MPPTLLAHITVDRGAGGFCAKKVCLCQAMFIY